VKFGIPLIGVNSSKDRAKPTVHHDAELVRLFVRHSAELVGRFVRYEINACSGADRPSDHRSYHDRSNSTRHVKHVRKRIILPLA
jgi:hypothetical protein